MIVVICKNTIEGIYSGIYQAYEMKCDPTDTRLALEEEYEPELFDECIEASTAPEKAVKVKRTLNREFGRENTRHLTYALVAGAADRADAVYHTIVVGLKRRLGFRVLENLADPYVIRVLELKRAVENEFLHLRGFLRFRELESGILYARMRPHHYVLELLMNHFEDRLPGEDFIIYDAERGIAGVHQKDMEMYYVNQIGDQGKGNTTVYSDEELLYSEWFRGFCKSIAIKERKNTDLQRQMLPLRFRSDMTEFL
ncbi:MAG: TIGR03915 family putative DNA repair protein [Lachnospiraceae bacterium]|nr:TIGR03915 family putative DNA repair protein [Lachnospiraceae bacterium]